MKTILKRIAAVLLAATMLLGAACTADTNDTDVTGTETAETPETEPDVTVPRTGPFFGATELSFKEQELTVIEKTSVEEHEFISTKESGSIFGIGDGSAKGSVTSLNTNTVASVNIGVKFNETALARYAFTLKASDPDADYDAAYFGLRLSNTGAAPNLSLIHI